MSELFDKRAKFTEYLSHLIQHMIEEGYTPLHGKDGLKHMKGSLHNEGLAVDIDLFKDGQYLTKTEDHKPFGEFWERLDKDCCWGGRFNDGNHYSVTYQGKK